MAGQQLMRPTPTYRTENALLDVIDTILDKGLVIDIYVRVRVVGIELLTIDARVIVASVDTYLRLARAALDLKLENDGMDVIGPLAGAQKGQNLSEFVGDTVSEVTGGAAKGKTRGAVQGVKEAVTGRRGSR